MKSSSITIEYALNRLGKRIAAENATKTEDYRCPHCNEFVELRAGNQRKYLAHCRVDKRTPLQRACIWYKEGTSDGGTKITNSLDRLYISNGGVPMYLTKVGEDTFELRLYFTNLSENSFQTLLANNATIKINDLQYDSHPIVFLNFHTVQSIKPWYDISITPEIFLEEVKYKWLWGSKGIDIEKDIFHAHSGGGHRLAINATIYLGKEYYVLFAEEPPMISGVEFIKKGVVSIQDGYRRKHLNVYTMIIHQNTLSAEEHIEGKGYTLKEKSEEIVPLWPPGIYTGNQLHLKEDSVHVGLSTTKNKSLMFVEENKLSNYQLLNGYETLELDFQEYDTLSIQNNNQPEEVSEIKCNLTYSPNYKLRTCRDYIFELKDRDNNLQMLDEPEIDISESQELTIDSNLPVSTIYKKGEFILGSEKGTKIAIKSDFAVELQLLLNKRYYYSFIKPSTKQDIDWKMWYERIYKQRGPLVPISQDMINMYYTLTAVNSEYANMIKVLLHCWIIKKGIPKQVVIALKELKKYMGENKNDR